MCFILAENQHHTKTGSKKNMVSDSEDDGEKSDIFPMLNVKKISFQGTEKNENGNIKNKLHACLYCDKLLANIARHLELVHSKEHAVCKILMLPKKKARREEECGRS